MNERRILVVDYARLFRFPAVYARSSREALNVLKTAHALGEGWDEVWFDHGLGPGDDVRAVLLWIEEQCTLGDAPAIGHVVVHSADASRAADVVGSLENWYPTSRVRADDYVV